MGTSRRGFFYFFFNNRSSDACQKGLKLDVKVSSPLSQKNPHIPFISSNPASASSPSFPWPFQPQGSVSLTVTPDGDGIPFINSNPAVPLPTGEVNSATIHPLPTSGYY